MLFSFFWLIPIVLFSWAVTRFVVTQASHLGLVHLPNNRSSHVQITPHGGGLGIVVASTLASVFFLDDRYLSMLLLGMGIALLGLWDDIRNVSIWIRFPAQSVLVCILVLHQANFPEVHFMGVELESWFLISLLILVGLWWVNLFNFMDGIDALASVQVLSVLLCAIILILIPDWGRLETQLIQVMLVVLASVLGFVILNWPPAKIFMGDVGSTWLAFIVLALALNSIQLGFLSCWVWLILVSAFLVDASITLFTRLFCGQKIFQAHRSHAYQKMAQHYQKRFSWRLDSGEARAKAHLRVSLLCLMVNGLWLFPLAWLATILPDWGAELVLLAWLPLCMAVIRLSAGRPETQ